MQVALVELVVIARRVGELGVGLKPGVGSQSLDDAVGALLHERPADAMAGEPVQRVLGEQDDLRNAVAVALLDRRHLAREHSLLLREAERDFDLVADGDRVEQEIDRSARLRPPIDHPNLCRGHACLRGANGDVQQRRDHVVIGCALQLDGGPRRDVGRAVGHGLGPRVLARAGGAGPLLELRRNPISLAFTKRSHQSTSSRRCRSAMIASSSIRSAWPGNFCGVAGGAPCAGAGERGGSASTSNSSMRIGIGSPKTDAEAGARRGRYGGGGKRPRNRGAEIGGGPDGEPSAAGCGGARRDARADADVDAAGS